MELIFIEPDIRAGTLDGITLGGFIVRGGTGMFYIADILLTVENSYRRILGKARQTKKY